MRLHLKRRGTQAEILRALVGRVTDSQDLVTQASDLVILNDLMILAININMLSTKIDNISMQLKQSGILEKVKDIEDIKELKKKLDKFTNLLKSTYEKKRELEARKKDLSYID